MWIALFTTLVLRLASPVAAQPARETPLNISADNMTGSHGPEGDEVLLNGHVRITRGRTVITAESGRYLRTQGTLYLERAVKMVDSTTTVTCDHASYFENDDVLQLQGNVVLTDRDAILRAPSAHYDRKVSRADLFGGVQAKDRSQRVTCDQATYLRDSLLLKARGNVHGYDDEHKLELTAQSVDFDRGTHEAAATGDPALKAKDEDGREAVIHALRLKVNTETRVAEALDSVRVVRDTLQARGDYGLFDERANRGWLMGHPRAWDDETTVSGDTLELLTEKRELKHLVVLGNGVMDYRGARPGTVGETSRLIGQRSDVYFTKQDIDSLVATGNARNEYKAVAQSGKTPESNVAQGDTITVFFKDRKIDRARVQGKASGEYQLAVDVGDTTSAEEERVKYDAAQIVYHVSKDLIVLDRAAHLTYRDLELTSRRVEYDINRQTLIAMGNPELVDRGDKVTGHLMTYDLESRVGNIYKAQTAYEKGLYRGERIRRVTDNQLDIMNGSYSTCNLADPHYHFQAHWMKIYLKDKLIAKPVVFYVRKVPLFALPFWIFPIKPGRHSGLLLPQVEFGFNNKAGQFIRNAGYYWAPNDYMDLTVSGDYYQFEPSWVIRAEGLYKLLYVLDGSFRASFAKDDALHREDWDLNADHSQELSPRTRLIARGSFVSSRDYNSSNLFGRSLSQRLNRFLTSSIAVSHAADWASFNAFVDRRQDLDADQSIVDPDGDGPLQGPAPGTNASLPNLTESLPTLSVTFPTRTIGSLALLKGTWLEKALSTLYFSLDSRFVSQHQRQAYVAGYHYFTRDSVADSTTFLAQRSETRRAYEADGSLSDSRRPFGWLNVAPVVRTEFAIFDHDELGHKVVPTGTWSAGLATSTTFYGTFRPQLGTLDGLRHVISPHAAISFSPEFRSLTFIDNNGFRQNRFQSFDGIGVSGFKRFSMDFGIDQRFQVKLKKGDQIQKIDNLLSWSMASSYNFLYREQNQLHPLSPISSNVLLQPPGFLNASLGWVTDVYSPRPVRSLGYDIGVNLSSAAIRRPGVPRLPVDVSRASVEQEGEEATNRENWSLGFAFSYSGGYQGYAGASTNRWSSSQTANTVIHYQITPGWGLDYSASYDVSTREIGIQRFALTRDLHCWQAIFTRTFDPGGVAEYYFRLQVKDQREIYIDRGTRGGSIGGID